MSTFTYSDPWAAPAPRILRQLGLAALALAGGAMCAPAARAEQNCFVAAGAKYKRDPALYYAIAMVESHLDPHAINKTHFARTGSVDLCAMQINSRSLPTLAKQGITAERLLNEPCVCVDVGASILEEKIAQHGNTWQAVGAYNASCTTLKGDDCDRARQSYVDKVAREYYKLVNAQRAAPPAVIDTAAAAKRKGLRVTVESATAAMESVATEN